VKGRRKKEIFFVFSKREFGWKTKTTTFFFFFSLSLFRYSLTHHGASFGGAVLIRAAADAEVHALLLVGRVRTEDDEGRELDRSFSSSSGRRLPQSVHFPGPLLAGGAATAAAAAGASICPDEDAAAAAREKSSRSGARSENFGIMKEGEFFLASVDGSRLLSHSSTIFNCTPPSRKQVRKH
jgi:hypothetical protein